MKNIKIKVETNETKGMSIPTLSFASEYFKCENCGYTVRMLVRGDTAHCSQCGGLMHRC